MRGRLLFPWAVCLRGPRPPPGTEENRDLPGALFPAPVTGKPGRGGAWSTEGAAGRRSVSLGSRQHWLSPWMPGARKRRKSFLPDEGSRGQNGNPVCLLKGNHFANVWEDLPPPPSRGLAFPLLGLREGFAKVTGLLETLPLSLSPGARLGLLLIGGETGQAP